MGIGGTRILLLLTYPPLGSITEKAYKQENISSHLQKLAPGAASLGQRWRAALPKNLQRQIKLNDEGEKARAWYTLGQIYS